jgi:Protein of unknown function (DUF3147)
MRIGLDVSSIRQGRWSDYALRFLFGGLVTALTGALAKRYGPGIAGLFLAFPAIFPAGATLIEKHEKQKKKEAGFDGTSRGRSAAGVDAAGAAMGALGLIAFAIVVWRWLPNHYAPGILTIAALTWLGISVLVWGVHKAL